MIFIMGSQAFKNSAVITVLRSRNYLFPTPATAPSLSIISAPAPAIYCYLKLYYNSSTTRYVCLNGGFFFILASFKLTLVNIYLKDNSGSSSRSQLILAPPAPALQHFLFI